MKLIFNEAPVVPSNFSDQELIGHIRYHFPDLSGSLLVLLDRFESNFDKMDELRSTFRNMEQVHTMACPQCGTRIQIDLELSL